MQKTICGIDCSQCGWQTSCGGCLETNGRPFGGSCMLAACCEKSQKSSCNSCGDLPCRLKEQLMAEFNALGIADMEEVTALHPLKGAFVNLSYKLPSGQELKFWDDNRIYLGNQLCKKDSDRCYGLTADEKYLLVCEYGENGSDAEIVVYKRRDKN